MLVGAAVVRDNGVVDEVRIQVRSVSMDSRKMLDMGLGFSCVLVVVLVLR